LVNRTLAIFRKAEFGFVGVIVPTFTQTPLLKGPLLFIGLFLSVLNLRPKAGDFDFAFVIFLGFLTN
jgi:hypothetical protein